MPPAPSPPPWPPTTGPSSWAWGPSKLEELAAAQGIPKVSRQNLAGVLTRDGWGGTTVSATMIAAALAGIDVFATGGIGGVHRGGEASLDISADLDELARTRVAVVCAGPKSILDVGRTLEALETRGVPVVAWQSDERGRVLQPQQWLPRAAARRLSSRGGPAHRHPAAPGPGDRRAHHGAAARFRGSARRRGRGSGRACGARGGASRHPGPRQHALRSGACRRDHARVAASAPTLPSSSTTPGVAGQIAVALAALRRSTG